MESSLNGAKARLEEIEMLLRQEDTLSIERRRKLIQEKDHLLRVLQRAQEV